MNITLVARADNSGLGTLSWEFARHLKPSKVLIVENGVYQTFPERYAQFESRHVRGRESTADDHAWALDGADVLLSLETFYSDSLHSRAKRRGVKTALVTMFEMTPEHLPILPDLFLCPSTLDLEVFKEKWPTVPSVFIPAPVATDRLIWKQRQVARHFVHTASHGGLHGRKGTALLLEAMKHVKNQDIRLSIYSWQPIPTSDPRIEIRHVNFANYWQAWREGDVLVYPQDYNGISLPVQEAYASGMGVLSTRIRPFDEYLPERLLFAPSRMRRLRAGGNLIEVDAAVIDPKVIAAKIDEIAGTDISIESRCGQGWAEDNSWEKLLPIYKKTLENIRD